ncbi:hypothetical protein NA57DRAFT_73904 [Rhizodiscina lignyota]|uniref:Uncharacterized protein n=1 Tax=Rhizodiscina lignyota TaxID=1504668 RepID=A0A9P4IJ74_9PEZI|nr:hypothetical protein NA57DRAFT_73904 [Rhizodiscina lignyota]
MTIITTTMMKAKSIKPVLKISLYNLPLPPCYFIVALRPHLAPLAPLLAPPLAPPSSLPIFWKTVDDVAALLMPPSTQAIAKFEAFGDQVRAGPFSHGPDPGKSVKGLVTPTIHPGRGWFLIAVDSDDAEKLDNPVPLCTTSTASSMTASYLHKMLSTPAILSHHTLLTTTFRDHGRSLMSDWVPQKRNENKSADCGGVVKGSRWRSWRRSERGNSSKQAVSDGTQFSLGYYRWWRFRQ